jgi:anti-anti-sigma regulatory factor
LLRADRLKSGTHFATLVLLLLRRLQPSEEQEIESMSATSIAQAHIDYELVDGWEPKVVVIGFVTRTISDPDHAHELGEQLDSLIRAELPLNFVIDFKNVEALGSTAFGEINAFARRVRWWGGSVRVCNLHDSLQLGAALIGLDDHVQFAGSRQSAIQEARKSAQRADAETVFYPASWN